VQARAEVTRGRILTAAAELFEQQGYTASPLTDIMARAGVTKGALYFHFSSKEELARAVVAEQRLWSEADVSHEFASALQTDVIARAAVRIAIEHGVFTSPDPTPYKQWVNTTAAMLEHAQRADEVKPCADVQTMAEYIVAAYSGVQMVSQVLHSRANLHEHLTTMWRSLIPLLVPEDLADRFDPLGSAA
jgi:AcrR family transcriptional regulator